MRGVPRSLPGDRLSGLKWPVRLLSSPDRLRAVPLTRIRAPHLLLMVATLAVGLAADIHTGLAGQILIGAAFWALLFYILRLATPRERQALIACLFVSTAGEFFLSLAWGLYTYRLGNIPLFVPPGHVLMFVLATALARRMSERSALTIAAGAAVYAIAAAAAGFDTLAILLGLVLGLLLLVLPRERRILTATFLMALGLELYGTGLGVWRWSRDVPFLGLVTTNPPGLSGAFYSVRDAMVAAAAVFLVREKTIAIPAPASLPAGE